MTLSSLDPHRVAAQLRPDASLGIRFVEHSRNVGVAVIEQDPDVSRLGGRLAQVRHLLDETARGRNPRVDLLVEPSIDGQRGRDANGPNRGAMLCVARNRGRRARAAAARRSGRRPRKRERPRRTGANAGPDARSNAVIVTHEPRIDCLIKIKGDTSQIMESFERDDHRRLATPLTPSVPQEPRHFDDERARLQLCEPVRHQRVPAFGVDEEQIAAGHVLPPKADVR